MLDVAHDGDSEAVSAVVVARCDNADAAPGSDAPTLVARLDRGRLSKAKRTPHGALRVPAALTREGVFVYTNADGTERREYRPADEVFKADSLSTLHGAPVTDLHVGMVRLDDWRDKSVGHVLEVPRRDGRFVAADLQITDPKIIEAVERGDRKELSCGYTCRLEMTPGTSPDGERYDCVQRDITYNHVALGPANWGRAGSDVALRLDGGAVQAPVDETPLTTRRDMKETIDGVEYTVGSPEWAQAHAKRLARLDAAEARVAELSAEVVVLKADNTKLTARLDEAERGAVAEAAKKVLGKDVKLDGKSTAEIRAAVVAKAYPEVRLDGDHSDVFAKKLFDAAVARADQAPAPQRNEGLAAVATAISGTSSQRADSDDEPNPEAARLRMLARTKDAWKPKGGK